VEREDAALAVTTKGNREKGDLPCSERGDETVAAAIATTRVGSGERGGEL